MEFKQVKALVTGGASGLGMAVARRIIAAGGKVCLLDINDTDGPEVARELGCGTCYLHTDVTSEVAVIRAVEDMLEAHGGLNLAVNCAGVIWQATNRFQIRSYSFFISAEDFELRSADRFCTFVGLIASCASCALLDFVLKILGFSGRY